MSIGDKAHFTVENSQIRELFPDWRIVLIELIKLIGLSGSIRLDYIAACIVDIRNRFESFE